MFSDAYAVVREVLVGARREAGLSQRALAERLGKAGSHVAMIERGQRRVDVLEFCQMAECFGLEPAELAGRVIARLRRLQASAERGAAPPSAA